MKFSFDKLHVLESQYRPIIVTPTKNGKYKIIDGNKYFKQFKQQKKVMCFVVNELVEGEYEMYRLLLNMHTTRLDYLSIAECIKGLKEKGFKTKTIASKIGLSKTDTDRYATLLDFDWSDFNKKETEKKQNYLL